MRRTIATIALITLTSTAFAAKCRSGKSILYTQDRYCPAGYTDITTSMGGTVSSAGKSANVVQQEQEFLQGRAIERGQQQTQTTVAQQQVMQQQANNASLCAALAEDARSLEAAMRQPNSAQALDSLKQRHRNTRDQMYRNGC
ncbi:hypothetical protein ACUXAV_002860 [Cupriavidus metallidurans]|uniref:hypothetical protein n=1 Tax=Cupriavidus metallidurans TaxID=119219 RepID=UPI0004932FA5|nr:hypothetical protein [Cupriavidus metallidurans]MDE4919805.1 hypothetical protein [Cupriavidus metallidurans]